MKAVCTLALSAVLCLGLTACSSSSSGGVTSEDTSDPLTDLYDLSGGTAATVNGTEIGENVITSYVEKFRDGQDLTDEEDWAEWLINSGYTSIDELRSSVIDWYTTFEIVIQAAEENDVKADEDKVDEMYQEVRNNYDSDEEWQEALSDAGTDEALEHFYIKIQVMEEGLEDKIAADVKADDDEVLEYVQENLSDGDSGKRSSHILFDADDEETAKEVLDKINSGELDFDEAAKEYSTDSSAEDGGDVGWDMDGGFVEEYQDALDKLDKDEVSGLITSDYGIHIIKCTGVLDPVEGDITSLDQVSDDYVDYARETLETEAKDEEFNTWMSDYADNADIEVTDMPENVSYYVDLSKYEDEDESADASDSSTSTSNTSSDTSTTDTSTTDESGTSADESSSTSDDSSTSTDEATTDSQSDTSTTNDSDESSNTDETTTNN